VISPTQAGEDRVRIMLQTKICMKYGEKTRFVPFQSMKVAEK